MHKNRVFHFVVWIYAVLVYLCFSLVMAAGQESGDGGNLLYVRYAHGQPNTPIEVVNYETGHLETAYNGRCTKFSPHRDYMAIYDFLNPTHLDIIDLANGELVQVIEWRDEWGQNLRDTALCRDAYWLNNEEFNIPSAVDAGYGYALNRITAEITGLIPLESTVVNIPDVDPAMSASPLFSPSRRYVVYSQCVESNCANTRYVVWDVLQEGILTELSYPEFEYPSYVRTSGSEYFFWSHDERYVAITAADFVRIFDVTQERFFDLSFVPQSIIDLPDRPGGWKWSPDQTEIAFVSNAGVGIINLVHQSVSITEVLRNTLPMFADDFVWSPSGRSLLVIHRDQVLRENMLYELDLETGQVNLIAEDVAWIEAWYDPSGIIPLSSP